MGKQVKKLQNSCSRYDHRSSGRREFFSGTAIIPENSNRLSTDGFSAAVFKRKTLFVEKKKKGVRRHN